MRRSDAVVLIQQRWELSEIALSPPYCILSVTILQKGMVADKKNFEIHVLIELCL